MSGFKKFFIVGLVMASSSAFAVQYCYNSQSPTPQCNSSNGNSQSQFMVCFPTEAQCNAGIPTGNGSTGVLLEKRLKGY